MDGVSLEMPDKVTDVTPRGCSTKFALRVTDRTAVAAATAVDSDIVRVRNSGGSGFVKPNTMPSAVNCKGAIPSCDRESCTTAAVRKRRQIAGPRCAKGSPGWRRLG